MEPIDSKDTEDIGWHLIARGGDMTARVHPSMCLGILPSGDLSFEAPDAVVTLDMAGQALTLSVVADAYEFETEAGERMRTVRVSPQTHVQLEFMGHSLEIDNDFAVASPTGNALALHVVRHSRSGQPLGPLSAPPHASAGEILVPERGVGEGRRVSEGPALLPVDYLQREHAAAAADKRRAARHRSGIWKVAGALGASLLVIAGLATVAIYVANIQPSGPVDSTEPAPETVADSVDIMPSEQTPLIGAPAPYAEPVTEDVSEDVAEDVTEDVAEVGSDVLARFSDLLEAEPLPDKATLEFAIESLRSLMVAYPEDTRVPAALVSLNERLVREARERYDRGDALRAGRLIEQAAALGMADSAVEETLDYFERQAPGRMVAAPAAEVPEVKPAPESEVAEAQPPADPAPTAGVTEDEAEAMLVEAMDREIAGQAEEGGDDGLDSLVESATGLALGALAVDVEFADAPAVDASRSDGLGPSRFGPMQPAALTAGGGAATVEGQVRSALDTTLMDAASSGVSANELPAGFLPENPSAIRPAPGEEPGSTLTEAPVSGPEFRAFSDLVVRRHVPLVYPRRAVQGLEGSMEVEFTVTPSGRVVDVSVRGEAPGIFLREAVRTIRQWEFEPVRRNGQPVPVRTALRVTYRG